MSTQLAVPTKPRRLTLEQRLLLEQLRGLQIPALPEVRFHPQRKWRIDVAACRGGVLPHQPFMPALAIEIEGGAWTRGHHVRGKGFIDDLEKYNMLTELGWRVLRYTPAQIRDGSALAQIQRCL